MKTVEKRRANYRLRKGCVKMMLMVVSGLLLALFISATAGGIDWSGDPKTTTRASINTVGGEANGPSSTPAVSAHGRYVAYESEASSLILAAPPFSLGDTNGKQDIFRKDTQTGTNVRVSTSSAWVEANNHSYAPTISADGRYVAFDSDASNLVADDTNGRRDVFIRDVQIGTTTRVSTSSAGVEGDSHSYAPSVSANGRYVAFHSAATNLISGEVTITVHVFVKDTQTGTTTLVSKDAAGVIGNGSSENASISSDGSMVAFDSWASNLVAADNNVTSDIFVKNLQTGTVWLASTDGQETQSNDGSYYPSLAGNGRYVAFQSLATNLIWHIVGTPPLQVKVYDDSNNEADVYMKALPNSAFAGTIWRASESFGTEGNSWSVAPSISANGSHVAFKSDASNFVYGDANGKVDVFVRSIAPIGGFGGVARVPEDTAGGDPDGRSDTPSISTDAANIAFQSDATDLIAGDTNASTDIFLATLASSCPAGKPGLGLSKYDVRWDNLGEYTAGILTVEWLVCNGGSIDAYYTELVGSSSSNGVIVSTMTPLPMYLGDIAGGGGGAGGCAPALVKYQVPPGVVSFVTTTYATTEDECGDSYAYPGVYPGT